MIGFLYGVLTLLLIHDIDAQLKGKGAIAAKDQSGGQEHHQLPPNEGHGGQIQGGQPGPQQSLLHNLNPVGSGGHPGFPGGLSFPQNPGFHGQLGGIPGLPGLINRGLPRNIPGLTPDLSALPGRGGARNIGGPMIHRGNAGIQGGIGQGDIRGPPSLSVNALPNGNNILESLNPSSIGRHQELLQGGGLSGESQKIELRRQNFAGIARGNSFGQASGLPEHIRSASGISPGRTGSDLLSQGGGRSEIQFNNELQNTDLHALLGRNTAAGPHNLAPRRSLGLPQGIIPTGEPSSLAGQHSAGPSLIQNGILRETPGGRGIHFGAASGGGIRSQNFRNPNPPGNILNREHGASLGHGRLNFGGFGDLNRLTGFPVRSGPFIRENMGGIGRPGIPPAHFGNILGNALGSRSHILGGLQGPTHGFLPGRSTLPVHHLIRNIGLEGRVPGAQRNVLGFPGNIPHPGRNGVNLGALGGNNPLLPQRNIHQGSRSNLRNLFTPGLQRESFSGNIPLPAANGGRQYILDERNIRGNIHSNLATLPGGPRTGSVPSSSNMGLPGDVGTNAAPSIESILGQAERSFGVSQNEGTRTANNEGLNGLIKGFDEFKSKVVN